MGSERVERADLPLPCRNDAGFPHLNAPDIEGVYIQSSSIPSYNSSKSLSVTNTPAPMPVQWLYSLRDGTIISPDPTSSGSTDTFRMPRRLSRAEQPHRRPNRLLDG